ncbi:MAG: hypothetical protein GEV06_15380 [Luteitalea sp.]|nr:hypothetical protein [Luteitalea sp.]
MLSRLMFVIYFFEVGLLLILVPWSTFWERNFFVEHLSWLQQITHNYYVRGAVSGIGLVSLGAAVADLLLLLGLRREASAHAIDKQWEPRRP